MERQKQFGEMNQSVARSYRNLGTLSKEKKDYEQSYFYYLKAKAICDSTQGIAGPLNIEITKYLFYLLGYYKYF